MEIFQKVRTPLGVSGIIVKIEVPFNGLYYSSEKATCVIWFGVRDDCTWVSREYSVREIEMLNVLPL